MQFKKKIRKRGTQDTPQGFQNPLQKHDYFYLIFIKDTQNVSVNYSYENFLVKRKVSDIVNADIISTAFRQVGTKWKGYWAQSWKT